MTLPVWAAVTVAVVVVVVLAVACVCAACVASEIDQRDEHRWQG
jgi:heme exporter protein D